MRHFLIVQILGLVLLTSCKKEYSCEGCLNGNKPPVANAGGDQTIYLPANSVNLDGSLSADPENDIVSFQWTEIYGPGSFKITNANAVQTQVTNFVEGLYQFQLKVTDAKGLTDKDTVQVKLTPQPGQHDADNVFFYLPDPTRTINYTEITFDSPVPPITKVTINNSSAVLSGLWCKSCSPRCPITHDYFAEPGQNYVGFNLPLGTYTWKAESSIIDLLPYPSMTPDLIQFWLSAHKIEGTVTVKPGDNCVLIPIIF